VAGGRVRGRTLLRLSKPQCQRQRLGRESHRSKEAADPPQTHISHSGALLQGDADSKPRVPECRLEVTFRVGPRHRRAVPPQSPRALSWRGPPSTRSTSQSSRRAGRTYVRLPAVEAEGEGFEPSSNARGGNVRRSHARQSHLIVSVAVLVWLRLPELAVIWSRY
jgi:hypothetical protein